MAYQGGRGDQLRLRGPGGAPHDGVDRPVGYVCLESGEAPRVVPVYMYNLNRLLHGVRDMGYELGALIASPPALHAAAAQAARPPVPGAAARPVQQGASGTSTTSATSFTSSSPALHAAAARAARPPVPGAAARPVQQGPSGTSTTSATSFTSSSPAALDNEGDTNPFDDDEYVSALAPLGAAAPLGLGKGQPNAASATNLAPTSKEFSADLAAPATREVRDNSFVALLCNTAPPPVPSPDRQKRRAALLKEGEKNGFEQYRSTLTPLQAAKARGSQEGRASAPSAFASATNLASASRNEFPQAGLAVPATNKGTLGNSFLPLGNDIPSEEQQWLKCASWAPPQAPSSHATLQGPGVGLEERVPAGWSRGPGDKQGDSSLSATASDEDITSL